jgi:CheY-like chemotaxis protein
MSRLDDVNPDVIVADAFLPKRSGFDICRDVKGNPKFRHVRVVLTAGVLEPLDETEASSAGSDALLKKPFEASVVVDTIRPLADAAKLEPEPDPFAAAPAPIELTSETEQRVRAAVTLALDAALPAIIDEVTLHVLIALKKLK